MGNVLLTFSISLDGYIAGTNIGVAQPMGTGGGALHEWMFRHEASPVDIAATREISNRVGAVVLGRRTFDVGIGPWADTPYPVPSFVLTHEKREALVMKSAAFTFVNEGIESALRQAKAAAGEKDIILMGANVAQQFLKARLVDEIALQLVPVLLGQGTRLFDQIGDGLVELARENVIESPFVTHLRFRIPRETGRV